MANKNAKLVEVASIEVKKSSKTKIYFVGIILVILVLLTLLVHSISYLLQTKDYVKVNAIVTNVASNNLENDAGRYYQFKYNYNYLDYSSEMYYTLFTTKKEGDNINIYINKNNPNEVRNTHMLKLELFIMIMLVAVFIVLYVLYVQKMEDDKKKIEKEDSSKKIEQKKIERTENPKKSESKKNTTTKKDKKPVQKKASANKKK